MEADALYEQLSRLERRNGGKHKFSDSPGTLKLDQAGVYYFFDPDETRANSADQRVVRIGTHAISLGSKRSLSQRLMQHWGTATGSGHSGGSQFRYLIGASISNSYEWLYNPKLYDIHSIEDQISQYLRRMSYLILPIGDPANRESLRSIVERNSIASLSNLNQKIPDSPSKYWLGLKSPKKEVRESGLWNIKHVRRPPESNFNSIMQGLVDRALK